MNGRAIASFLFGLLVLAILVGVGAGIYQAGVTQGIIDAGRFPAGETVPVAGYGWGHGFGIFGLLFFVFFLFLLFGLARAAFSRGRGWGRGYGWGPGWGKGYGPEGGPDSWREERDRRMSELHRRLHEAEGDLGSSGRDSGPSGGAGAG